MCLVTGASEGQCKVQLIELDLIITRKNAEQISIVFLVSLAMNLYGACLRSAATRHGLQVIDTCSFYFMFGKLKKESMS